LNRSSLPLKDLPAFNKPVKALLKHWDKWEFEETVLLAVNEDDCQWRFKEDGAELANEWNVVYWEYLNQ